MQETQWVDLARQCDNLSEYIDYMAIVTGLPEDYIIEGTQGERLTLDEAFEGLRANLKKFEKRIRHPEVIAQGYKTFDEAYEHYKVGRELEANTLMINFQYLLCDVRSGKYKRQA